MIESNKSEMKVNFNKRLLPIMVLALGLFFVILGGKLSAKMLWSKDTSGQSLEKILDYMPFQYYEVKEGDTISAIASLYNILPNTILSINGLDSVDKLREGLKLAIIRENGIVYRRKQTEPFADIAQTYKLDLQDIFEVNQISPAERQQNSRYGSVFLPNARLDKDTEDKLWKSYFSWPVMGKITQNFGNKIDPLTKIEQENYGISFRGLHGSVVRAPKKGVIEKIAFDSYYGMYMTILHDDHFKSFIGNLGSSKVVEKQEVSRFDVLGEMEKGNKNSSGQLFYLLFKNNQPVDPAIYLR